MASHNPWAATFIPLPHLYVNELNGRAVLTRRGQGDLPGAARSIGASDFHRAVAYPIARWHGG
ncbi:MAG: hypothetical protein KGO50_06680 [Myxococcales bacterium]|nr:hypothetical protein [Myxococcales bacterium]